MKIIVSLLITSLVITTSAFCADSSKSNRSDPSETPPTVVELDLAYAILPAEDMLQFPACDQVNFTQLIAQFDDVRLCKGGMRLPAGVYRINYAAQLQNTGGTDVMQLWLTSKALPSKKVNNVPDSSIQIGIDPAIDEFNPSFLQVFRELLIVIKKTTYIHLNYSTRGESNLSSLPPSGLSPISFYLQATKLRDI